MLLFVTVIILSLLILVIPHLIKKLPIAQFMRKRTENSTAALQRKLNAAQEELKRIKAIPLKEYSYHIQMLRAEESVKNIETSLKKEKILADMKVASAETLLAYGTKAFISFVLLIVSIKNRYTPVMIFNEDLNFQPLTGLLSFPTGVNNAISLPIWTLSCNVTLNFVSSFLKNGTSKKTR